MRANPDQPRVVVTGLGAVSPLGPTLAETWSGLLAGKDAAAPVTLFDTTGCRSRLAATAKLPPLERITPKRLSRLSRASRLALPAAIQALSSAGLLDGDGLSRLPGLSLSVSTSAGAMSLGEEFLRHALKASRGTGQYFRASHYQPQRQILDLQEHLQLSGPTAVIANACASGSNAVGHGADLVRCGMAGCVLAGGFEALSELLFVGFDCIQASTTDRCRPFDRKRSGLMLGEAAAFLVLESEAHARNRGARVLCELAGYGHSTDPHHLTQPQPAGDALLRAMSASARQAGVAANRIAYVNAHGTGTVLNDRAEIGAFERFFKPDAEHFLVSSTKAAIGHTLGAAGAIEAAIAIEALRSGRFPPQINLQVPEPGLEKNLVPPEGAVREAFAVMSVNLGFGGSNAALVFTRHEN